MPHTEEIFTVVIF